MILQKELIVKNPEGIHARPAGILVKTASEFKAKIELIKNSQTVNAKSIMSVMTMGLKKDDLIHLKSEGEDAEAAILKISTLFENQFHVN